MIDLTKKTTPALLLVPLLLAAPSCASPDSSVAEDDGTNPSTGEDEPDTTTGPSPTTADETGVEPGDTSSGSSDSSSSDSGSSDSGSSDSGIEPSCGNGLVDAGEDCDGIDLAGGTCETQGFTDGTLSCSAECTYDISGCANLPAEPVLALAFSPIKQLDLSWAAAEGAEFYRVEESAAPGEPFVPIGGDIVGESLSLEVPLHLRHQASYRLQACNAEGCKASAVVGVMSTLAEAVGYVKASNPGIYDFFGQGLALSGDGNTLAIGSPNESNNATGIDGDQASGFANESGAVYVFTRDAAGAWSQAAYIKASNTDAFDHFGRSVALSEDGSTLAVGAELERSSATGIGGNQADDSAMWAGAVYVFARAGAGTWSQAAYIKASNTDAGDQFGTDLALSDDGDTLAVGALGESSSATGIGGNQLSNAADDAGAAYVFVRSGMGTWSQQAYVKASNSDASDHFGYDLALSDDGNTLAVVAAGEASDATGIDGDQTDDSAPEAGAVYVFGRDGAGAWSQQAYVKASNTSPGDEDHFGTGVALSADGSVLAVGAGDEDGNAAGIGGDEANDSASDAGAVYVLVRAGAGAWSQRAYVKASNPGSQDYFGDRVALSDSGNTLAVTATGESSGATGVGGDQSNDGITAAGAVYLY